MSITEKQLEANRLNAQKSTGPKTEEGKKTVSQNAVKHGLNSSKVIINSRHLKEDQAEYEQLVASLFDELKPQNTIQKHLVHKIANCIWRYRRVITAETAEINDQLNPNSHIRRLGYDYFAKMDQSGLLDDYINSHQIPTGESAELYRRYEWRLNRELHHAYTLLRLLKIAHQTETITKNGGTDS